LERVEAVVERQQGVAAEGKPTQIAAIANFKSRTLDVAAMDVVPWESRDGWLSAER
jgi:hypothetical protein